MPEVADQFKGLPIGLLICQPILEVAKGQAALCKEYLDAIFRIAFVNGDEKAGEAKTIKFKLQRLVTNSENGTATMQDFEIQAPLLSLVPVPAFTMEEATVRFTMEVKEQVIDKTSTEKKVEATAGFNKWGFSAKVTGGITNNSSNTRQSDHSAKYDIYAKAIQQPPAEGMARLTSIFASVIEPMDIS